MGMRQSEPQAGDDSKKAMDEKQKDVARRSAELKKKQAEAAGVYKEGYATPLRVDSPAGVDLDADKDPEEQPAGFDLDVEEERDDPADRERLMSAIGKIGSSNQAMELARQRRAGRKRDEEDRRRSRTGPQEGGDGGGGPGGDPPKSKSLAEENEEIYKQFLPEDVVNDPDPNALKLAAEDAAEKNYNEKYANQKPRSVDYVTKDGEEYEKEVYQDGAVFYIRSGDQQKYRGQNEVPSERFNTPVEPFELPPFFDMSSTIERLRLAGILDSADELTDPEES
tara:strand:- start:161 stop:1003 length:843 start_codon:yes stop_codon:yes gene_type:complete